MKNKFTSASTSVMERAQRDIDAIPEGGAAPVPPKTQTRGATGKLAASLPQSLPITGQKLLSAKRVRIREGFERAEAEYKDAEFNELLESIKASEGNIDPIDVRLLDGVAGFEAELLAGTRRLMACRELGISVLANVRQCDDRMADRIHETENKHRKNKSPYSRGLQYKAMLDSGRYTKMTDLADSIMTRLPEISEMVNLIEKAPKGMWDKVVDAGSIKTTQIRPLMAAYEKPAFVVAIANESQLTVARLVELASAANKPARATNNQDTRHARLGKKGGDYCVLLPQGVSEELAKGAVEAARKYIESRSK